MSKIKLQAMYIVNLQTSHYFAGVLSWIKSSYENLDIFLANNPQF